MFQNNLRKVSGMARGKPKDCEKNKGGRPTLYKKEYNEQVVKLCKLGATDEQIADFFDVALSTISNWKLKEPEFMESIKNGKLIADMQVADSLFKRATGYEQETIKVFQFQGSPVIVPVVEKITPDTTAQIFWLKNRQPKLFRDRQEVEHSGEIKMPTITIGK